MRTLASAGKLPDEPSFRQEFYGLVAPTPKGPIYIGREKDKPKQLGRTVVYDPFSTNRITGGDLVANIDEAIMLEDDVRAILETHSNPPNPELFVMPTMLYCNEIYGATGGHKPMLSQFKICKITITAYPVILKGEAADRAMQRLAVMDCSEHEKELLRQAGLLDRQDSLSLLASTNEEAVISSYVLYNSSGLS